jgi:hypothetical protein
VTATTTASALKIRRIWRERAPRQRRMLISLVRSMIPMARALARPMSMMMATTMTPRTSTMARMEFSEGAVAAVKASAERLGRCLLPRGNHGSFGRRKMIIPNKPW